MPIVKKAFSMTTETGSVVYREGHKASAELAQRFPQFMEGYEEKRTAKHDPSLPASPSKKDVSKMDEATLQRWIEQYHPEKQPEGKADKEALQALVNELNGR